jgi:hypothetical protein
VKRGLVKNPENWKWCSFNHYATGVESVVEIESHWTAKKREQFGVMNEIGSPAKFVRAPPSYPKETFMRLAADSRRNA